MMKKGLLAVTLVAVMMLLSGCMSLYGSTIESMFGVAADNSEHLTQSSVTSSGTDTVTVSKTDYDFYKNQYERLSKFSELADLYDIAEDYFYWEPDDGKMLEYAAKGLMAGLDDPYSFYYSSEEFEQLWEDDEGNYVGIGVMIQSDTCTISRVFKGGPAEEAGVLRGDVLYRVGEDLYVTAETLSEAISIMRGEPGTFVDVTFLRDGEEITYTIQRREVVVNQIESVMLDDKVGYIAMYQFAGEAEKEFEEALNSVVSQGAESLIIDLRDNGGGWVEQARYIGDLFMDKGELCYLVYRDGTEDHLYRTYDGKTDILITVLVNENTASSSEILTGALRDCANATVVGTKSFGKGIVQNVDTVGNNGAGYQITIADFERAKVMDEELDPEELEKVSGGAWGWCWSDKYCFAIEDLRW